MGAIDLPIPEYHVQATVLTPSMDGDSRFACQSHKYLTHPEDAATVHRDRVRLLPTHVCGWHARLLGHSGLWKSRLGLPVPHK